MSGPARLQDVLFETMREGIVYQDREGVIRAANPAAERILGIPRAQLVGASASLFARGAVREDGSPFTPEQFRAAAALRIGQATEPVVVGYPLPDGSGLRWLSIYAVPVSERGGEDPDAAYTMLEDITERRELETRRAREATATARLAALALAVPGVVLSTALSDAGVPYATFVSDAVRDVFGLEPNLFEHSLDAALSRTHPDEHERLMASIQASILADSDWHETMRYDHPTKGERVIEGWMRRQNVEGVPSWAGVLMDVTDREKATAALNRATAKYKGLFDHLGDAIYVATGNGRIVDANPAACRMHGMTVAEICERGREGLVVHDDLHARWLAQPDDAHQKKGELLMLRKDGSTFPAEVQTTGALGGDGPWTAFVIARDITERRAAEEEHLHGVANELARVALERSAQELREAQRIAGVGSFTVNARTGAGTWSEEMFRIMGRDPALGVPNLAESAQFARPEVHERVIAQTLRLLQTGEPLVTEAELSLADGTTRQVVMRMEATRDEHGVVTGGRGTYQDVTEQRALEDQVSKSQRLDAIGSLAAGVAHDFNNLLGIIVGYAQCALADLPEANPLRDDLGEVVAAGMRGASLTHRLLTFASRENVQPVVHRPGDVVRDMGNMLGRLISEDISLTFSVAADAGEVFADPGQIEQVVMNLVINARDAMPDGGALTVSVASSAVGEGRAPTGVVPGPFVEICVQDTGVGMDDETRARMFEAFFTTKAQGRGTGLGLSTVQRIVRQCGGFIEVDTKVGGGTRVAVLLPRVAAAKAVDAATQPARTSLSGPKGTVLLVEDDPALRGFAERSLARGGYRVIAAAGGEEALKLLREGAQIDVLVTDVVMPGMGGVEVSRAVRDAVGDVPVLFMSGYAGDHGARPELLADARHFLAKPFAAEDLLAKVGQVWRKDDDGS